jgi:hypothetical protein
MGKRFPSLNYATSGTNSDILALTGLTTPISVPQGGTGSTSASGARGGIGAAASGANSDILSLTGLTTPLTVGQGGIGASSVPSGSYMLGAGTGAVTSKTPSQVRSDIGAAASGANSDILSITGLTTPLSALMGGNGISRPIPQMQFTPCRRVMWKQFDLGTTTSKDIGWSTAAGLGTLTTVLETNHNYANFVSATAVDSIAGYPIGGGSVRRGYGPVYYAAIKTGASATDIQNCRIWAGWSNVAQGATSDYNTASTLAFRFASASDGTTWQAVWDNGTGSLQKANTAVTVSADTRYELIIDCYTDLTKAFFYIGVSDATPTLVATATSSLPSLTNPFQAMCLESTTETVAKNIRISMFGQSANS